MRHENFKKREVLDLCIKGGSKREEGANVSEIAILLLRDDRLYLRTNSDYWADFSIQELSSVLNHLKSIKEYRLDDFFIRVWVENKIMFSYLSYWLKDTTPIDHEQVLNYDSFNFVSINEAYGVFEPELEPEDAFNYYFEVISDLTEWTKGGVFNIGNVPKTAARRARNLANQYAQKMREVKNKENYFVSKDAAKFCKEFKRVGYTYNRIPSHKLEDVYAFDFDSYYPYLALTYEFPYEETSEEEADGWAGFKNGKPIFDFQVRWSKEGVTNLIYFKTQGTPRHIRKTLRDLYGRKAEGKKKNLKGTPEYGLNKKMLNSLLGCLGFNQDWDNVGDTELELYAHPLYHPYLVALGQEFLKTFIATTPNVVYCDTDSIYTAGAPSKEFIEKVENWNSKIGDKPGKLELRDVFQEFKAIDVKRYAFKDSNSKIEIRYSGLPRKASEYFKSLDEFKIGVTIPKEFTHRYYLIDGKLDTVEFTIGENFSQQVSDQNATL